MIYHCHHSSSKIIPYQHQNLRWYWWSSVIKNYTNLNRTFWHTHSIQNVKILMQQKLNFQFSIWNKWEKIINIQIWFYSFYLLSSLIQLYSLLYLLIFRLNSRIMLCIIIFLYFHLSYDLFVYMSFYSTLFLNPKIFMILFHIHCTFNDNRILKIWEIYLT